MVAHDVLKCGHLFEVFDEGSPVPLNNLVEEIVHDASAIMDHLLYEHMRPPNTVDLVLFN